MRKKERTILEKYGVYKSIRELSLAETMYVLLELQKDTNSSVSNDAIRSACIKGYEWRKEHPLIPVGLHPEVSVRLDLLARLNDIQAKIEEKVEEK